MGLGDYWDIVSRRKFVFLDPFVVVLAAAIADGSGDHGDQVGFSRTCLVHPAARRVAQAPVQYLQVPQHV